MEKRSSIDLSEEIIKNKDRLYVENIQKSEDRLKIAARDNIYPILLGCYDKHIAETELEKLRDEIKKDYPNTLLLKDIPDRKRIDWNKKFKHHVLDLKESGGFVFPIVYLHPVIDDGKGKGLINEVRDITDVFPYVFMLKTLILTYKNVGSFEHIKYFPNIELIENLKEASQKILSYLNRNLNWIEYKESLKRFGTIHLNIFEYTNTKKGDANSN